mgnify:FL=1
MICPMMSFQKPYASVINCQEEKCAWWNKNCGKCAIATLAENSESVSEAAGGQRTIVVREV